MINVQDFISHIGQTGLANLSRFDCLITGVAGMPETQAGLTYRIRSASFPGRGVGIIDYVTYGPPQAIGIESTTSAFSIDVILSEDFAEKLYFERWQDKCVGYARGSATPLVGMFDIGFYDEYKGTVQIRQYDAADNIVHSCTLIEAWPVDVGDIQSSWHSDELASINVKLAYRYYINDAGWTQSQNVAGLNAAPANVSSLYVSSNGPLST